MTLSNRVAPDGTVHAVADRGGWMGNRGGVLHDPAHPEQGLRRRQASRRWICCVLDFKGRRRAVWRTGYTELFFLDEVTALASGHRPCFECRRDDAKTFAAALAQHLGTTEPPRADAIDRLLAPERIGGGAPPRILFAGDLAAFPDGVMVERARVDDATGFLAHKAGRWRRWSFAGWSPAAVPDGPVRVVTPTAAIGALRNGYAPEWHPSAEDA